MCLESEFRWFVAASNVCLFLLVGDPGWTSGKSSTAWHEPPERASGPWKMREPKRREAKHFSSHRELRDVSICIRQILYAPRTIYGRKHFKNI